MSVCIGVQDSGGVGAACYLRNLSTECKVTEITMVIFNFKRPLQVHDLPFPKVFKTETACRVAGFVIFIDNWFLFIAYLQFLRPKRLTDLLKFLY